jgi:thiol-disulfide isomerase/thioredoxin
MIASLLLTVASATQAAPTTAPSADDILGQLKALTPPPVDQSRMNDRAYVESYAKAANEYEHKRGNLTRELFANFPDNPQSMKLMSELWIRTAQEGEPQQVLDETARLLGNTTDPGKRADLLFVRAFSTLILDKSDAANPAIAEFVSAAPKDPRGGQLLFALARAEQDPQKKNATYRRVIDQYPLTQFGKMAQGLIRQTNAVGKPFDLTFTDAISGKEISLQKDLKGKVVVIDFWATWCGPCVGEMPKNKEIYSQYKDKGVEFIGVSLDQPAPEGLNALKTFIAKNEIPWPQYFEGKGWDSDFSAGWGINSIPTMFVIDKQGKLASVSARGQLETLIPKLLAAPMD